MRLRNLLNKLLNIVIIALLLGIPSLKVSGQANLDKNATVAKNRLINRQNVTGTWWTFFNFDTVPENFKRSNNFFAGMLIADLLQPFQGDPDIDSIIQRTLDLSHKNINPENGFLKYYNRMDDLPEDTDDTGLFWYLNQNVDTGLVSTVIDSLEKYKTKNGLYLEWLRKGGIKHMPQTGTNPETVEIIPNIHVYLFLSKYDTLLAHELCQSLQAENVVSNPEYWVYYYRAPWLYYIRQVDMVKHGCELGTNLPNEIKGLVSQDVYEKLSVLIRDITLDVKYPGRNMQARELLFQLSKNNFEFIWNNPMLIYHSDLTSKAPAHFWSKDLPFALWLRLYHEYSGTHAKKK